MEITGHQFYWDDNSRDDFFGSLSIEPFDPNSPDNYVPFPVRRGSVHNVEENISKIKDIAFLLRQFLVDAHNFLL
jgi:hypothetical protein